MDTVGNVLRMDHVTMQFGGAVAVNGLSLDVNEHEIVTLIGPNGAGKTTAFNCVAGICQPTYGSISFNSQVILMDTPQGRMRRLYAGDVEPTALTPIRKTPGQTTRLGIARTFRNIRLFGNPIVFENVLIARYIRAEQNVFSAVLHLNHAGGERMRDGSLNLLEMQGLVRLKDEAASSLLYGLQRRLEIARALTTSPNLLLLDEPAASMNPQETQDLTDFTKQIRGDYHLTIPMIEHHMDLIIQTPDRVYVLNFDKLITRGTLDKIQNNPKVIEAYLRMSDDAND